MSYSPSIGSNGRSYFKTLPFIDPKNDFFFGAGEQGTSFATGLPCFVMVYSTPVSLILSISSRHLALKSAAATDAEVSLARDTRTFFPSDVSDMTRIL